MANFKTHVSVAAALSGVLATGFLAAGVAAPKDVWLYFAMGTVGVVLPLEPRKFSPLMVMRCVIASTATFVMTTLFP